MAKRQGGPSLRHSLDEYGRGVAGGLLFSLPLLYTEEVWQGGSAAPPLRLLLGFLFTFALLLGYNRYAGLRRDANWQEIVIDSVEEQGLGILLSALLMWLLDRIHSGMSFEEAAGLVLLEAQLVAVGVSVGTAQLGGARDQGIQGRRAAESWIGSQVVLGVCGAFLIVAAIAPTIEIVQIGSQASPWKLLGLALISLALGGIILYFSNFIGSGIAERTRFSMTQGVLATYAVALVTAALVLWFFGRFDGVSVQAGLSYVVTAGLPAVLGASAGRLLLQV